MIRWHGAAVSSDGISKRLQVLAHFKYVPNTETTFSKETKI